MEDFEKLEKALLKLKEELEKAKVIGIKTQKPIAEKPTEKPTEEPKKETVKVDKNGQWNLKADKIKPGKENSRNVASGMAVSTKEPKK